MGNRFLMAAFLLTGLVFFLFQTLPAAAAEPVPGGACSAANLIVTTGGPETTGVRNQMICNGATWQQVTTWLANGYVGIKTASPAAPLQVNGEVIIGATTGIACGATVTGALRWSSASNTVEMCDGTVWQKIAVSASFCDNAPAVPVFADQTDLATSTLTTTNIALVTGMDAACNATISIGGTGGSPQYRVCSDAACSTVTTNWTNASNSLAMQGQYVQLRATSSASVATNFAITLSIGGVPSTWNMSTNMSGCTSVGTVCGDGTVYAGLSGVGTPMYTTRCDAGQTWNGSACTGTRLMICWNNCNSTGYTTTGITGGDGRANTAALVAADSDSGTAGVQPHLAAQYCKSLSMNGHSDWYLPSRPEYNTLYNNQTAIGNFHVGGSAWYWISEESDPGDGYNTRFTDGYQDTVGDKGHTWYVRCARR